MCVCWAVLGCALLVCSCLYFGLFAVCKLRSLSFGTFEIRQPFYSVWPPQSESPIIYWPTMVNYKHSWTKITLDFMRDKQKHKHKHTHSLARNGNGNSFSKFSLSCIPLMQLNQTKRRCTLVFRFLFFVFKFEIFFFLLHESLYCFMQSHAVCGLFFFYHSHSHTEYFVIFHFVWSLNEEWLHFRIILIPMIKLR